MLSLSSKSLVSVRFSSVVGAAAAVVAPPALLAAAADEDDEEDKEEEEEEEENEDLELFPAGGLDGNVSDASGVEVNAAAAAVVVDNFDGKVMDATGVVEVDADDEEEEDD